MKNQKFIRLMLTSTIVPSMALCAVPAMAATRVEVPEVGIIQGEVEEKSTVPVVMIEDDVMAQLKADLGDIAKYSVENKLTNEEVFDLMQEKLNAFSVENDISVEDLVIMLTEEDATPAEEKDNPVQVLSIKQEEAEEEAEEESGFNLISGISALSFLTNKNKSDDVEEEVEEKDVEEKSESSSEDTAMRFLSTLFVSEDGEVAETFETSPVNDGSGDVSDVTTFETSPVESDTEVPAVVFETSGSSGSSSESTASTSTAIASVNGESYSSLQDAIDNANGGTVTLLEDITISEPILVTGFVILDLNEHTITNETNIWDKDGGSWSLISVQGGDLTISNGTVKAKANDCYAIDVQNGGTLTIKSGTYVGNVACIYVLEGTLNISGGNFSIQQKGSTAGAEYSRVIDCNDEAFTDSSAKVSITGGTFDGFNPEKGDEGTSYLAEGYGVIENTDGSYTVAYGIESDETEIEENIVAEGDDIYDEEIITTEDADGDETTDIVSITDEDGDVTADEEIITTDSDGDTEDDSIVSVSGVESTDSAKTADISLLAYAIPALASMGLAGGIIGRRKNK